MPKHAHSLRPQRIRDLAQITGIPRETVRRKLRALEATGRVSRTVDGWVINVDAIEPELREVSRRAVQRFRATARTIENALAAGLQAVEIDGDDREPG